MIGCTWADRSRLSPNLWPGRNGHKVKYIVLHGTDGDMPGSWDWLTSAESQASTHYIMSNRVTDAGKLYQMVSEDDTAWGNGVNEPGGLYWGTGINPNYETISIEIERGLGNLYPILPATWTNLVETIKDIKSRIGNVPLIPHSAISPLSRPQCPGPNFSLPQLTADTAPTITLKDAQWLQKAPHPNNAVPNAHVPAGQKIAIHSEPVPGAGGSWLFVQWRVYYGYVPVGEVLT